MSDNAIFMIFYDRCKIMKPKKCNHFIISIKSSIINKPFYTSKFLETKRAVCVVSSCVSASLCNFQSLTSKYCTTKF